MQADYSRIWPYVAAALAVLLVYRRFRRSFGPQPVRAVRMGIRIALLVIVSCTLVPAALKSGQFLLAELAGAAAGICLGIWGARHTRFASVEGRLHYVPHTIAGVAVSVLFIARLVYRLAEGYGQHAMMRGAADPSQGISPTLIGSPSTMGIIFTVAGYYVCYTAMVLWKAKRVAPEDLEIIGASSAAPG